MASTTDAASTPIVVPAKNITKYRVPSLYIQVVGLNDRDEIIKSTTHEINEKSLQLPAAEDITSKIMAYVKNNLDSILNV